MYKNKDEVLKYIFVIILIGQKNKNIIGHAVGGN